jgi:NAD dependent epimerase/dehydratase
MAEPGIKSLAGTRCLVTGASGFIGSHLVEMLVTRGAQVRAFIHYGSSADLGAMAFLPPDARHEIEIVAGDILDVETVVAAARGIDVVFHLAALVGIPYSYRSPRDVVETNVMGTLNVLTAVRTNGVARLVHTSTSEVYGSARAVPMSESHPLVAQSPYSASKIAADQLTLSFHRSFDVPASIVRPFNTYGPRQTTRAIIPTIISQALAGKGVALGSLSPTRDFNYVTDTAEGFVAVATTEGTVGQIFNVGTGVEVSIGDLVRMVGERVGRDLEVESDPDRVRPKASEVDRLVSDASRLRTVTGWAPHVDLEDGLGRTVEWIREHPELFDPVRYAV